MCWAGALRAFPVHRKVKRLRFIGKVEHDHGNFPVGIQKGGGLQLVGRGGTDDPFCARTDEF